MTVPLRAPGRVLDRYAVSTALLLGALVVATWPVLLAAAGPGLPAVGVMAHVCGLLAGHGVLVLLFLESRWPPLERGVGSDVLARWHSWGGRAVIGLILLHAEGAIAAEALSRGEGGLLSGTWQVLGMPALPAATIGTLLMVAVAVLSARAARRRLRHETWHGLHLLMYVAVALSFGHHARRPRRAASSPGSSPSRGRRRATSSRRSSRPSPTASGRSWRRSRWACPTRTSPSGCSSPR